MICNPRSSELIWCRTRCFLCQSPVTQLSGSLYESSESSDELPAYRRAQNPETFTKSDCKLTRRLGVVTDVHLFYRNDLEPA